jgi:hypothetical protein
MVVSAVVLDVALAMQNLEKWSIAMMMYLLPLGVYFSGPDMSVQNMSHGLSTRIDIIGDRPCATNLGL